MPPYVRVAPPSYIFDYYRAISEAIDLPIFIQNHDAPAGTRLSPEFVARLVQESIALCFCERPGEPLRGQTFQLELH